MAEPNATARLFVGISELVQPHAEQGASQTPIDVTRDAGLLVAADGRVLASGRYTLAGEVTFLVRPQLPAKTAAVRPAHTTNKAHLRVMRPITPPVDIN